MTTSGDVVREFYGAAVARDFARARRYLKDDLVFVGLFETYRSAGEYLRTFEGLLGITVRLDVKTIIAEGDQAAIFYELQTRAPAEATVLVAEWHQLEGGRIAHVESAFDGRPYAAMFAASAAQPESRSG